MKAQSYNLGPGEAFRREEFGSLTEDEIVLIWRFLRATGLSPQDAWHAIAAGIALDQAFSPRKRLRLVEQ
jgi:hypothetical protein